MRLSAMELTKCFPGLFDPRPRQPVDSVPSQKAAPSSGALAQVGPWEVKRPYLGTTAMGLIEVAPGEPYNILAVGLFCGSRQSKAPRINLYVYGLHYLRLASKLPVEATFTLDGNQLRAAPLQ
jgi:hypothetical protein